jgi:hypothetical protein
MRLLVGFAFAIVGIACVQSQLVLPQLNNNLNAVVTLLPQLQVNSYNLSIFIQNYWISFIGLPWSTQQCSLPTLQCSHTRSITNTSATSSSICFESILTCNLLLNKLLVLLLQHYHTPYLLSLVNVNQLMVALVC